MNWHRDKWQWIVNLLLPWSMRVYNLPCCKKWLRASQHREHKLVLPGYISSVKKREPLVIDE